MSDLGIDQVLAQIRALSAQAAPARSAVSGTPVAAAAGAAAIGAADASSASPPFGQLLKQGIDAVNAMQQHSNAVSNAWERGDPGVNLAQVMVETQKASVSFQALAQVRNRLISAYQDIMNMTI